MRPKGRKVRRLPGMFGDLPKPLARMTEEELEKETRRLLHEAEKVLEEQDG